MGIKVFLKIAVIFTLLLPCTGCLPDKDGGTGDSAALQGSSVAPVPETPALFQSPPVIVDRADTILVMNREVQQGTAYPGLTSASIIKRGYPYGSLASPLLGFRGQHGHGLYGIEYFCDTLFSEEGRSGLKKSVLSPDNRLKLTINKDIQLWAEQDLERQIRRLGAKSGSLVMMDIKTGEIIAMASLPGWNPEDSPGNTWKHPAQTFTNHAIEDEIDAWMFFPILEWTRLYSELMAAESSAADEAESSPESTAAASTEDKNGAQKDDIKKIFARKGRKKWSWCSPVNSLAFWSPWRKEATENFSFSPTGIRELWKLGLGQETGLYLSGEKSGSIPTMAPSGWEDIKFNTVRATPVQMARAFAALINAGRIPAPTVIKNARPSRTEPADIPWLTDEASKWVLDELSLDDGPSIAAVKREDSPGTDELTKSARLKDGRCQEVVSMGFWPEKNPDIVYVSVLKNTSHDPRIRRGTLGKTIITARRAWGLLDQESIPGIKTARNIKKHQPGHNTMPNLLGMTMRQAVVTALELGLVPRISGSGTVTAQRPGAGAKIGKDMECRLECSTNQRIARR